MTENWQVGGFGLYLHWPFCEAKCPYCDFNSHVSRSIDHARWTEAFLQEIDRVAAETSDRVLKSVYFGGGTPSLMREATVGAIIDRIARSWTLANDIEITLEANPGSVEAARFAGYREAGVNRVSLGVQALNDRDLRRLGRLHDVHGALHALDIATTTFDRVSFDLIYARQDQTLKDWETELKTALQFAANHLSLYQLTIEDGTAFGDRFKAGKLNGLPVEDSAADMYALTQQMCRDAGFPAYEVSNHARPGSESRHNLIYWRAGDYAGIGPGAHGRLTFGGQRMATEAPRNPLGWLSAVDEKQPEECTSLSPHDVAVEYIMMGLRTNEPLDLSRLKDMTGVIIAPSRMAELTELGVIDVNGHLINTTETGRPVLNAVISELIRDLA